MSKKANPASSKAAKELVKAVKKQKRRAGKTKKSDTDPDFPAACDMDYAAHLEATHTENSRRVFSWVTGLIKDYCNAEELVFSNDMEQGWCLRKEVPGGTDGAKLWARYHYTKVKIPDELERLLFWYEKHFGSLPFMLCYNGRWHWE